MDDNILAQENSISTLQYYPNKLSALPSQESLWSAYTNNEYYSKSNSNRPSLVKLQAAIS